MYLYEQLTMYKLATDFVKNDDFTVLHINDKEREIWLEKHEHKTSNVIRIQQGGFDWKNHLKRDIAQVFQKTKVLKRLLSGKYIEIQNIYISSHEPVDEWELLKKPMQLNEKNPLKMNVYYVTEQTKMEELSRLQEAIGTTPFEAANAASELAAEQQLSYYKIQLTTALNNARKEVENVFSYGKPFFTYILLALNILMYFILEINGGSTDIPTLIQFGAKYNPAIVVDGEWWRIIASMFLHIGLLHLVMNMIAVYYLGTIVEKIYGSWRFLIIYFLAGIGGGLASFAFTSNVSAGASGALFGLFGALLFFGVMHKKIFFQTMGKGLLLIIGINIVFGFTVSNIDMGAHVGGLITGFLASVILYMPKKKNGRRQFIALIVYVVIISSLVNIGINNTAESASYYLYEMEGLLENNDYEAVVEMASEGLANADDMEEHLRFQRSYANIHLNKPGLAISDLEKVIQLDYDYAEAFHNLASLYYNNGEIKDAKEAIQRAYELNPDDDSNSKLYERIMGEEPN